LSGYLNIYVIAAESPRATTPVALFYCFPSQILVNKLLALYGYFGLYLFSNGTFLPFCVTDATPSDTKI